MIVSADSAGIAQAVSLLRAGEVVAIPTETRYGLAVAADSEAALARLQAVKGRGPAQPISVLVADRAMLDAVVAEVSTTAEALMARHWPGPLTLVLPAHPDLPAPLRNADGGVGVRISPDPIAQALVSRFGAPLTATSANLSGQEAATDAQAADLPGVALTLDDGRRDGRPSTVAEVRGAQVRVLRQGGVAL